MTYEMTYTAYATTSINTLGANPGISVFDADGWELDREDVSGDFLDSIDGELNRDAADAILEDMRFIRVEDWHESNGQWIARVESMIEYRY